MFRATLGMAALAFAAGLAGSAMAGPGGVVQLDMLYCWGSFTCTPSSPVTVWIYGDGTFETSEGYDGTWDYSRARQMARILYTSGTEYTGTVNGTCGSGTQVSYGGLEGAWSACVAP